jgi:hypothetical protein
MKGPMNILIYAALAIFPVLGLLLMGYGVRNLWRGMASASWPQATGVVRAAEAGAILVAYRVEGSEFTTSTEHFGEMGGSSDPSEAELARLRYPAGGEFPVAYNPGDPSISALKPGFTAEALTIPVIGLAVTLAGVMFLVGYHSASGQEQGNGILVLRLFCAVFMVVGLLLLTPGLRNLFRARASVDWPRAAGVIRFSQVTSSTCTDRDEDGTTRTTTTYNSPLVYQYEVNGRKRYSNTRRFGQLAGSSAEWAQEIADKYPAGKQVQVAYSPSDPDLAVLEPGVTNEAYFLPGAGAAFFLFGFLAVVFIRF